MRRNVVVCALVATLAFACHRSVPLHGYTYSYASRGESGESEKNVTARVYATADDTRVEYDEGDGDFLPRHSIVISRDAGKNMIVLNSDEKTYYEISGEELTKRIMRKLRTKAGAMDLSVDNVSSHISDDGPDQYIESLPTKKYVVNLSYDVHVAMAGQRLSAPNRMKARVWTTDKIPEKYFDFLAHHGVQTGFEELDRVLASMDQQIKGFPLRQTVETQISFQNQVRTTHLTSEVTNLKETTVESSMFRVPAEYTKVSPNGRI